MGTRVAPDDQLCQSATLLDSYVSSVPLTGLGCARSVLMLCTWCRTCRLASSCVHGSSTCHHDAYCTGALRMHLT